jgi:hypothetical protein
MKGKSVALAMFLSALLGCDLGNPVQGRDLSEEGLEAFFRKHTVNGNHAVAAKVRFTVPSPGVAYLLTVHGYPNNLSVCEELIAPYNKDPSLSVMPGNTYFCEVLR